MRISVLGYGFVAWNGGLEFLRFITSALRAADPTRLHRKQIVFPTSGLMDDHAEAVLRERFADQAGDFEFCFCGPDYADQFDGATQFGADVVLPCLYPPPPGFTTPWIGYLYDFQHRHYPSWFTVEEMRNRDQDYADLLHQAPHAIANSHDVVVDARRFFGAFPAKLHALPFSPNAEAGWIEHDEDVRAKYGIDRPYFMVSNQFWVHKDHPTALRAFGKYLGQGGGGLLVCTGEVCDYRSPQYPQQLQALVEQYGLGPHLRVLGLIPKLDQVSLIKRALAMIQPTLFEGGPGGGAVYNAIALATPALVSDIPVNREITCGDVRYFPPGDAGVLAALMLAQTPTVRPSNTDLLVRSHFRRRGLGEALFEIIEQAVHGVDHE